MFIEQALCMRMRVKTRARMVSYKCKRFIRLALDLWTNIRLKQGY